MRPPERRGEWPLAGLVVLGLVASAVLYLWSADRTYRLGLPLDDSWIHQTYARNLAEYGEWSFLPGSPSAGSTAPLWSALLSVGYWLRLNPLAWTYGVGLLFLFILAWLVSLWVKIRAPDQMGWAWVFALLTVMEWHLVWASVSGMETLALGLLAALVFFALESRRVGPGGLGLLIGVGAWIRPDALTLAVGPVGQAILEGRREAAAGLMKFAVGLALGLVPYLLWQRSLSGQIWPNTFFAKQAEYAALREIPLLVRLAAQAGVPGAWFGRQALEPGGPLIGVMAALAPGLVIAAVSQIRNRQWDRLLPLVWSGVFLGLYALRLPVTYQHGRYAMPVLPVWLAVAGAGMLSWVQPGSGTAWRRILSRTWIVLVPILAAYFWLAGARAYAQDVAIIESEMVESARWIEGQTPEGAVVAAHDIGALGYFSNRDLIDLAGLVSPQAIPFLHDEPALARYLHEQGADYLVTFPSWYPELTRGREPVFVTGGLFSPAAGGENMAVYRWNSSSFAPCGGCAILADLRLGNPCRKSLF